jgi:glycerate dehydrogenase
MTVTTNSRPVMPAETEPLSIVFLDRGSLGVPLRPPAFPHAYTEYDATRPDQVVARLEQADIAIVNKVPMPATALAQLPRLKLIAVAATGTDTIDKAFCTARGITVSNVRGYAVNTVPEHVLALIFALRRSLVAYDQDVRRGRWGEIDQFCYFDHPIHDIAGSTIGIVGYGALGRAVGQRAEALGMTVIATGRSRFPGLHCPLTAETRNMIGAAELAQMRRHAILINTARGGLVDEAALVAALEAGTIAGAGVDVLTTEPPRHGNVLLDDRKPNLIVTPHVAWASVEAMTALAEQLVGTIEAFAAGAPRNIVAP